MSPVKTRVGCVILSSVAVLFVVWAGNAPAQPAGLQKKGMNGGGQMRGQKGQFGGQGHGQQDQVVQQEIAFLQGLLQQLQMGAITSQQMQVVLQQRIAGLQALQEPQQNRGGQFGGQQQGQMRMKGKR